MAAWGSSKHKGELIESSKSEDDLKMEANEEVEQKKRAGEEVKKGAALPQHCKTVVEQSKD